MAEVVSNKAPQTANGIGIAALIVGIVAFLSGWVPVWGFLIGVAAIVLGIIALKKSKANKGFGIAGVVLGGIAVLTGVIFTIFWVLAFSFATIGTGGALDVVKTAQDSLNAQTASVQEQIDAKKDFSKGQTAKFGDFEVSVKSVTRDYTSTDSYTQPSDGNEFVVVKVSVKNVSKETQSFTKYDLKLIDGSVANDASFVTSVDPSFTGGNIIAGGTADGNIVFEAKQGASGLKLQYETTVYDYQTYQSKTLTYTLAL